jgi:hypothetical protein
MASLFEPTVREISEVMHLQLDRVLETGNSANKLTVFEVDAVSASTLGLASFCSLISHTR